MGNSASSADEADILGEPTFVCMPQNRIFLYTREGLRPLKCGSWARKYVCRGDRSREADTRCLLSVGGTVLTFCVGLVHPPNMKLATFVSSGAERR